MLGDVAEVREIEIDHKAAIARKLQLLKDLKQKKKNIAESLQNILENSSEYNEVTSALTDVQVKLKQAKLALLNSPEGRSLQMKRDDLKEEEKEVRESLAASIEVFVETTGETEIDIGEDDPLKIIKKFQLQSGQLRLF